MPNEMDKGGYRPRSSPSTEETNYRIKQVSKSGYYIQKRGIFFWSNIKEIWGPNEEADEYYTTYEEAVDSIKQRLPTPKAKNSIFPIYFYAPWDLGETKSTDDD